MHVCPYLFLTFQVLSDFITNCLEEADRHDTKYIAFPTLGTGALKYPPDVMAKTMKKCITSFDLKYSHTKLHHIYIVVYDNSTDCMAVETVIMCCYIVKPVLAEPDL